MSRREYDGSGLLTFYQQLATRNPIYQRNGNRYTTTHLILHSTGANNPNLRRYVTPDDGYLGVNPYDNGWNNPSADTLVHGVIGKNKDGLVEAYQITPWGKFVWGCGAGPKGSGNSFAIQVEMCEDQTLGAGYARETYQVAVKLFAHLCRAYSIPAENIWSHKEAHAKGYASGHKDPEHWWDAVGSGLTMDGFRADVAALLEKPKPKPEPESFYRVQVGAFSKKAWAELKLEAVRAAGFPEAYVRQGRDQLWRVQIGAFKNREYAQGLLKKVQGADIFGYVAKN